MIGTMAAFVGVGGRNGAARHGRAGRRTAMAFGPFMGAGSFVALAWTGPLLTGLLGR